MRYRCSALATVSSQHEEGVTAYGARQETTIHKKCLLPHDDEEPTYPFIIMTVHNLEWISHSFAFHEFQVIGLMESFA
jgi:hypothetical protein